MNNVTRRRFQTLLEMKRLFREMVQTSDLELPKNSAFRIPSPLSVFKTQLQQAEIE
jgi:hypothetical protein